MIQCYGPESKKYLTDLINKKEILVEFDPTQDAKDSYGRFVAYLFLDGKNINQQVIQE
ncbi:thermonuclease family protein [Patescibacteria group bacterium]|nr:thermonuclease family protein [Patescibacteria group bacterium]MBU1757975.1 thermonuclease family protein [Patescibacteria group bacterium]